jgi:6-phosphogluconate dehydrogenase
MNYRYRIVGLRVMEHNLILNVERNVFALAGYDPFSDKAIPFLPITRALLICD